MFIRRFLLLLAVVVTFTGVVSAQEDVYTEAEVLLFFKINEYREENGLAPLELDEKLYRATKEHNEEMARLGYFDHTSPTPGRAQMTQRATAAGYKWRNIYENICRSRETEAEDIAQETLGWWMTSPFHNENLLAKEAQDIAVAVDKHKDGDVVVTVMLGRD
jgi:uncharacterized protein YkwD